MLVIVAWFMLFSSSSFACNLCTELEKRGFSPERIGKGISEHLGGKLKATGSGKPFFFKKEIAFNLAADKNGRIFRVGEVENLRGVSFIGTINNTPAEIFVAGGVEFIGIKIDTNFLLPRQIAKPAKPVLERNLALRSFEPAPAPLRQAIATPTVRQTIESTEIVPVEVKAEQIIETSMSDASTLLSPVNQVLQEQKEVATKTDQLVKRVEYKKKERDRKLVDAGVTTAVVGTAFIPGVGPFIASGIVLARVGWGLFQSDPDDENP